MSALDRIISVLSSTLAKNGHAESLGGRLYLVHAPKRTIKQARKR